MKLILIIVLFFSAFVKAQTVKDILAEGMKRKVKAFLESKQGKDLTALILAQAISKNKEVLDVLEEGIKRKVGAVLQLQHGDGLTVLDLAQRMESEKALEILEEDIKRKAEAFLEQGKGLTALELVQILRNEKVLEVLEEEKRKVEAFLESEQGKGLTALEAAQRLGNKQIIEVVDSAVENLIIRKKLLNNLEETIKKSFEEFVASRQSKGLTTLEVAQGALGNKEVLDVLEEGIRRQFKELEPPAGVTALAWQKAQSFLEKEKVRDLLTESISKAVKELEEVEWKKETLINSLKETLKKSFKELVASGQSKGLTALEVVQGVLESEETLDVLEKDINMQIQIRTLKSASESDGLTVLAWAQRSESEKAKAPREYDLTALELAKSLEKLNIRDLLKEAIDRAAVEFLDEKLFAWARRKCVLVF